MALHRTPHRTILLRPGNICSVRSLPDHFRVCFRELPDCVTGMHVRKTAGVYFRITSGSFRVTSGITSGEHVEQQKRSFLNIYIVLPTIDQSDQWGPRPSKGATRGQHRKSCVTTIISEGRGQVVAVMSWLDGGKGCLLSAA